MHTISLILSFLKSPATLRLSSSSSSAKTSLSGSAKNDQHVQLVLLFGGSAQAGPKRGGCEKARIGGNDIRENKDSTKHYKDVHSSNRFKTHKSLRIFKETSEKHQSRFSNKPRLMLFKFQINHHWPFNGYTHTLCTTVPDTTCNAVDSSHVTSSSIVAC